MFHAVLQAVKPQMVIETPQGDSVLSKRASNDQQPLVGIITDLRASGSHSPASLTSALVPISPHFGSLKWSTPMLLN
jgi:hypothetical protein